MADIKQLVESREWLARSAEERAKVVGIFKAATPEVQEQIVAQLTPATPAEKFEEIAPELQWLPGMEFMHALPESAQRTVAGYLPGIAAGTIQTGAQLAGAALGGMTGPAAPVAVPVFEGLASLGARKLNVALGFEEPGMVGDIASVALPPLTRGVTAALPTAARISRAGRAVTTAGEQTTAATEAATQQTLQEAADYAEQVRKAEQTAAAANTRAQEVYAARTQQAQEAATAKTAAQEAKYQRSLTEKARLAEERTAANQAAYEGQVQAYEGAVQQHRTALGELQAMPGQFRPETPSSTLYAAAAKANPQVELRQTAAMAEELMGTPEGLQTIQRGGVQSLAEELHGLAQQSLSKDGLSYARLQKIRSDLGAEVGRLRRQGGVEYAEVAKLYGALERDIGSSPAQVLQAASKARRQEYAVEELNQMVQTGAPGIKRLSSGAYQVEPGQLMTRAEKALGDTEKLFGGSFTPDERANILGQFERHQGLAPIPRRPGDPPLPVVPSDVTVPEPVTPRSLMRPVPVSPKDVGPAPTPVDAPPPVDPRTLLEPPSVTRLLTDVGAGGLTALYSGSIPGGVKVGATIAAADVGEYVLSKMLLSPKGRPLLDKLMSAEGTISPQNMAIVMNAARAIGIIGGTGSERR
jgi:hypothetical protein